MKQVKTQEELDRVEEFFKYPIFGLDVNYTEKDGQVKGFACTFSFPMIQLHAEDMPEVIKNFYTAYGKAIGSARGMGSQLIGVLCNNEKLEKILKEKEGFAELGYKILTKEV